jgi:hypothetical protein
MDTLIPLLSALITLVALNHGDSGARATRHRSS